MIKCKKKLLFFIVVWSAMSLLVKFCHLSDENQANKITEHRSMIWRSGGHENNHCSVTDARAFVCKDLIWLMFN